MCGIFGFSGNFDRQLLTLANNKLEHRGPDDAGEEYFQASDSNIGLAHRRLSIIDLSEAGKQPLTVNCSCCVNPENIEKSEKLWLIFNGEIYNYLKLKNELIALGHQFTTHTDSEVLLHLYTTYGTDMLKKLNGIFAFAIYDGRAQGQKDSIQPGDLFLARDHLGVKPLYYTQIKNGFLFASEIKALLMCKDISRNLDYEALYSYITHLWCPAPKTPLTAISKLLPGEAMLVRNKTIKQQWFYYDIPYGQNPITSNFNDIAVELAAKIENAVNKQLISDVPIGAFLSGGLDSSAIVAMMRKINPDTEFNCFTMASKTGKISDNETDDLPYAEKVAKHLNLNLHKVYADPSLIKDLPQIIYHLDEPQADLAPINVMLIAKLAKQHGIKVLMSGAGGDDIFSGYRRHVVLGYEKYWTWLPQTLRQIIATPALRLMDALSISEQNKIIRKLKKLLRQANMSDDRRLIDYFCWGNNNILKGIFSNEVLPIVQNIDIANPLMKTLSRLTTENSRLNRMLYLESKHFLADHNLNYTDKASMAMGVETRVPLLDVDIIDFAARIPSSMKLRNNETKAIFKRSMEPFLPKEVIYRPKTGFGLPLRRWLHNDLSEWMDELLSPSSIQKRGIFNPRNVKKMITLDRTGKMDLTYNIFSLLCIEIWCRQFIDVETPTMNL